LQEKVKYLIVGQGLTGTWLSYFLQKKGLSFKIINDAKTPSATRVASGVINPVTGRKIVQTWMIDALLPFAVKSYTAFQQNEDQPIIKKSPIAIIHPSLQMKESFDYRLAHENIYLKESNNPILGKYFNTPFGNGEIDQCYWIDLTQFLMVGRKKIGTHSIEDHFKMDDLTLTQHGVQWKNIDAEKLIFCDGINGIQNLYFKNLPFAPNKGEALIVKIKGLDTTNIYKTNVTIVPWKEDLFWVGSSYEWSFNDAMPSIGFKEKMITALDAFLKIPYEIVDHLVGIRPANTERRPFVGLHPLYPQLGICNGMGTKGCSLAPYFTNQLIHHIEDGAAIETEADVKRFTEILSAQ
jgi:glycine/D-amino acid oxidase-like deaminating enzyme